MTIRIFLKNFLYDFQCVAMVLFKIHLKFSHVQKEKNLCSLPLLPHENIECRKNNTKGLV